MPQAELLPGMVHGTTKHPGRPGTRLLHSAETSANLPGHCMDGCGAVHRHRTKLGVRRKWQAMHWPYRQWASSQAGSLPFRSPTVSVDPLQDQAPASLASGAGSSQPEQPAAAVELQSQPPAEPAEPGPAVPALPLASLPVGPRRTVPAGDPPVAQLRAVKRHGQRCGLPPAAWEL